MGLTVRQEKGEGPLCSDFLGSAMARSMAKGWGWAGLDPGVLTRTRTRFWGGQMVSFIHSFQAMECVRFLDLSLIKWLCRRMSWCQMIRLLLH